MLTMQYPFTDMDIENVQILRSGTVYKLTGHCGEGLVIKAEISRNLAPSALQHAKVAMKAVDKRAGRVKLLADSEKRAIADWVAFMKRVTSDFSENKINNFDAGPAARELEQLLKDPPTVWYKMPLEDLTDADKLLALRLGTETGHADKSVMRRFADGLKEQGGLEQLGKIIAADMYISNGDRFNPKEGSSNQYGGKDLKFRVIANVGNVFVIGKNTQQRLSVAGHDFLDPNSGYRHYDLSLQDISEAYVMEEWLGEYLCDSLKRKKFAKDIIHDLETILTPNRKSLSPFRKLGRGGKATKRLEQGMLDGMRDIVNAVDRKYGQKMPVGVKQRRDKFVAALAKT